MSRKKGKLSLYSHSFPPRKRRRRKTLVSPHIPVISVAAEAQEIPSCVARARGGKNTRAWIHLRQFRQATCAITARGTAPFCALQAKSIRREPFRTLYCVRGRSPRGLRARILRALGGGGQVTWSALETAMGGRESE